MKVEERLSQLGITLEQISPPKFSYIPVVQTGNLVYTSAHDCKKGGKLLFTGKLGKDLSLEEGQQAARQCVINCLSAIDSYIGNLNRIKKIVKVLGFVQSAEGFQQQPYVINGASDLLLELFGENGRHARSAIGTNELPFNTPVQVELIVELEGE